jgi:hypothetical protein
MSSDDENIEDAMRMPKKGFVFKEAEYREWLVASISHVPLLYSDEMRLENLTIVTDQFTSLSTEMERQEDVSEFNASLDSWLRGLNCEGSGKIGESCTLRPELIMSPKVIGAPLRSVRPDKRAQLS